jgi:hypothetical protein
VRFLGRLSLLCSYSLAFIPLVGKAYLQAIVDRIEVDDSEIRIFGRKDKPLNQLISDRPKPAGKVRSFGREWRARCDESNNWNALKSL